MKASTNMGSLATEDVVTAPGGPYTFRSENIPCSITLHAGESEMLRVTDSGFYVRGVQVPVDDQECVKVYNAFTQWLNWQILNRNN